MERKKTSPQLLADALLELSRKKPVDKITIREITEQSGLSNQTFYNYFQDKYDLMLWIYKSVGDKMVEELHTTEYTFRRLTEDNLQFYADHATFILNALDNTSGMDSYLVQSSENAIAVLEKFILEKNALEELTVREKAHLRMWVYACSEIFAHWAREGVLVPIKEMADYILEAMPSSIQRYLSE